MREFHEVIDFLPFLSFASFIHHSLTVSPVVSTTFVEQFWMSAKSKIINNVRYITAKVAGKPVSISEASIRSDLLFDDADGIDSLPNQAIFDAIQLMGYEGDLTVLTFNKALFSPQWRPSPTPHIPDSILKVSGGNHGGQSSSDKSLLGNEGDMTLQIVYDLCISLCTQVTDQAKEIKHLKAQIKKLKQQAKPVITHHRAWMKSVSLKQRLAGKKILKANWMQKESVSKQGRKSAKAEPSVHKDPLFDELDDDEIDKYRTLDGAIGEWFKKDCIGSVTTWEDLVEKFVQKFYQLTDHNEEIEAEEDDDPNDITDIFKIEGNLFDYETPFCKAFKDFNYLLKINTDLVGSMTYFQDHKWYDELADGKLKEETLMHKAKVEEPLGNTTLSVMKLCAWLINSFGNFHELDYNVLVKLQECWWKINAHEVARFTRLENYGHRPYADFKTEKARVPYLEINNIFGRNYDTSLSSQKLPYRTAIEPALDGV
ncbi:hypothetical protein Tco_0010121 [Tanacetum coccineum]